MDTKDRFPLLRKILGTLGLPKEAIDDIIERILDWLSAKDQPATGAPAYPSHLRDDFLSPAELSFFQVLRSVTGQQVVALAKVNLTDLFFAQTGDARRNRAISNRIDRKHVDFLLCDSMTMRPLLGIELDDRSHERPERKARDELVALIQPFFASTSSVAPAKTAAAEQPVPVTTEPFCPKCGVVDGIENRESGNQRRRPDSSVAPTIRVAETLCPSTRYPVMALSPQAP